MNVKALIVALGVALVLAVATWSRPAHAEKVTTNQSTQLHSRAGEQSPVVLKVKSGQTMTVLAKDGRWIKVRVSGRTGWIPRSKVDIDDDDEQLARNTRRRPFVDGRSTKRGFGGDSGPDDRVGADATGDDDASSSAADSDGDGDPRSRDDGDREGDSEDDDRKADQDVRPRARVVKRTAIRGEADADSEEAFVADPRTALYVIGAKGKWTYVENDEGEGGYVLTSKLEIDAPGRGGPRKRALDVRGRLGVALVRQSVSTPGGPASLPDNYGAGSSSLAITLGASALFPVSKRYWAGGEISYDYDRTLLGGIDYNMRQNPFTYHNFNLRASGGYDLQTSSGMIVLGRLGYHYDSFQVANVLDFTRNTAKLPSQIVRGPVLGTAVAIPRLTRDIGLRVSLDAILFGGSVKQTVGLEDGTGPRAKAVFLGGIGNYRWKPRMDLQGTYDLGYTSIKFSGPAPEGSMRGHATGTTSSASALVHTFSVGVNYAF